VLVGRAEAGEDAALERPLLEDLRAEAWTVETLARSITSRAAAIRSRSPAGVRASARARSSLSRRRSFIVVAAFS